MAAKVSFHLEELRRRLQDVKSDPMSSVQKPIYPVLEAIRVLLCDDDQLLKSLTNTTELFEDIISECVTACEAVDEIVCCDSPEGYLPEQLQLDQPVKAQYVTSRILLLNGWKTVMESLTIISHLVAFSLPNHAQVTCSTARKMVAFFYDYQNRLVHRGAFEQSARAFSRLVSDLWGSGCQACCEAILNLLKEIQHDLTDGNADQTKFLLTRRSAGLPYVLQSILACEQWAPGSGKMKKSKRPINDQTMGATLIGSLVRLLQPANRPHAWQVITGLNIFKALITDSRLANVMTNWIEEIFLLCIDGWFDRRLFPSHLAPSDAGVTFSMAYCIQNCSSGLFSALMTRVFGVKRNRCDDSISSENQMSLRLFFTTYPSLYPVMLKHLEKKTTNKDNFSCSVCPVVSILERLTVTADRNAQTLDAKRFKDFDFGRLLSALEALPTHCTDSRIIDMATRAFAHLLAMTSYGKHFQCLYEIMNSYTKMERNSRDRALRGAVLLSTHLVKQCTSHLEEEKFIREVLLRLYNQINQFLFFDQDTVLLFPGQTYRQMHLLQTRIYTLATLAGWSEYHEESGDQLLFNSLEVFEREALRCTGQVNYLAGDQLMVALLMDTLVHILPITVHRKTTTNFGESISSLATSLRSELSLDCRLLFWSFLNELLLFVCDTNCNGMKYPNETFLLLRREHFFEDTVFGRELEELMSTVRQFDTAGRLDKNGLTDFLNAGHLYTIIGKSEEWTLLLGKANNLTRSVQWDIIHEMLCLLYNCRQVGIFPNLPDCFAEINRQFPALPTVSTSLLMQLFNETPLANELTNGHCSMTALLQVCLNDELVQEEDIIDIEGHLTMAKQVYRLSQNACLSSVGVRQVAMICLATSLSIWSRIAHQKLRVNGGFLATNFHLPQMLCTLFSALFSLLQDWDESVKVDAEGLLKRLASEYCPNKVETTTSSEAVTRLAVSLFVELHRKTSQQLARFAVLRMVVDLFLEDVKEMNSSEEEEHSPFEKSKLSALSDFDLLAEVLLRELATFQVPTEPVKFLTDTVQTVFRESIHEALIASLVEDINYIEMTAKEQSSPNQFESFISKLKQAFN